MLLQPLNAILAESSADLTRCILSPLVVSVHDNISLKKIYKNLPSTCNSLGDVCVSLHIYTYIINHTLFTMKSQKNPEPMHCKKDVYKSESEFQTGEIQMLLRQNLEEFHLTQNSPTGAP